MKRRITSIILAVILCVASLPIAAMADTKDNVITGKTKLYGIKAGDFEMDLTALTSGSNTEFNSQIARAAILVAFDMDNKGEANIAGDGTVLSNLGFKNIQVKDIRDEKLGQDFQDSVGFTMARQVVKDGADSYAVYLLNVRPSFFMREWDSNVDMGADSDEYRAQYGSNHPEWKHQNAHKGFDIAANRVLERLDSYIKSFASQDKDLKKTILVTGHSRGAAVTNLIGKELEDRYSNNKTLKPYTYTFAAPTVASDTEENLRKYKTIFNVLNKEDVVPYLPLEKWGFKRYGKDCVFSIEENCNLKKLWIKENMNKVHHKFMRDYLNRLISYSPVELNALKALTKLPIANHKPYESSGGMDLVTPLAMLLTDADASQPQDRNCLYEYKDLVWIPNDIDDAYSKFYQEAPYDVKTDKMSEKAFNNFAKQFNCKRVRVATSFMLTAVERMITTFLTDPDSMNLDELNKIAVKVEQLKNAKTDAQRDKLLKSVIKATSISKDLKALISAALIKSDLSCDKLDLYAEALVGVLKKISLNGVITAHFPTTYYFAMQHKALE